jgi:hypothetical protein
MTDARRTNDPPQFAVRRHPDTIVALDVRPPNHQRAKEDIKVMLRPYLPHQFREGVVNNNKVTELLHIQTKFT